MSNRVIHSFSLLPPLPSPPLPFPSLPPSCARPLLQSVPSAPAGVGPVAGVSLPPCVLSHRWTAATSPATRQTAVGEGLSGQGRGGRGREDVNMSKRSSVVFYCGVCVNPVSCLPLPLPHYWLVSCSQATTSLLSVVEGSPPTSCISTSHPETTGPVVHGARPPRTECLQAHPKVNLPCTHCVVAT